MSTHPRIATLTPNQAELLGLLLDERTGPAPQGPCLPERAEVRRAVGETTLVVIHGAGGGTLYLHQLAPHLPPDLGLAGINADFANDGATSASEDAETLIGRYVAAVRAGGQPGAPLHLGGYSSGCLIALEVARRIEASSAAIASLTLIDPARLPASETSRQDRLSPRSFSRGASKRPGWRGSPRSAASIPEWRASGRRLPRPPRPCGTPPSPPPFTCCAQCRARKHCPLPKSLGGKPGPRAACS